MNFYKRIVLVISFFIFLITPLSLFSLSQPAFAGNPCPVCIPQLTPHNTAQIAVDGTNPLPGGGGCGILFSWYDVVGANQVWVIPPGGSKKQLASPNGNGQGVLSYQTSFTNLGVNSGNIASLIGKQWSWYIYAPNGDINSGNFTFSLVRGNGSNACGLATGGGSGTDYCQYATQGDGGYCGSVLGNGADTNFVYTCSGKTTNSKEDCSNKGGCIINSSGSDYCKDDKGGGGGGGGGGCTTVKTYNECEQGNATYCLSHGVPKGHVAQVTQTTCGYSCKDLGPCSSSSDTKITLSLKLDGIGTTTFENNSPKHPKRTAQIRVYDVSNSSSNINNSSQTFTFDTNGNFSGVTIDLGTGLKSGSSYKVEVKLPGYLPATADVKPGDTSQVIDLEPTPGDINQVDANGIIIGDGKIDINDYSIFRQCRNVNTTTTIPFQSGSKTVNVACGDLVNFFDYQDGGTMENVLSSAGIGEWDTNYNLWLRSYIKANNL